MKILIYLTLLFCLYSCSFAGSYAYAEYYDIANMTNEQLVEKVIEFKNKNNKYKIVISNSETCDQLDENGFYTMSFYIAKDNMIIYCVINLNEIPRKQNAKIGLTGILDSFQTDNAIFSGINELSKEKKEKVIRIFEDEILNNLGVWKKEIF